MVSISSRQHLLFAWHAAVALAVRVLLVLWGAGEALVWQPEVTTPANTALGTREGLALLQLGVSPYAGDACHVPPLWLAVTAPVALRPVLCVLPNIIADAVAAAALYAAARALYQTPRGGLAASAGRGEGLCMSCAASPGCLHRHQQLSPPLPAHQPTLLLLAPVTLLNRRAVAERLTAGSGLPVQSLCHPQLCSRHADVC
jgi:hypothetical protein